LGTIPDFSSRAQGVRLAGATEGSPAARAGLREGDVIVQFAGRQIQTLEDLIAQLRGKKPGDDVEIVVLRSGQPITFKATLRARS
jgi:S1-C subfamily serine protease